MEHALDTTVANPYVLGTILLFLIFNLLATIGFVAWRWGDGLWGTILLSFNLVFSTLLALNFYEPIGKAIASSVPIGLFYWDSLVYILLLLITFIIFTLITDKLSRVMVKFPNWVEIVVKPIYLLLVWGTLIISSVFFVLQIGPTAPKPFGGRIDIERSNRLSGDVYIRTFAKISSSGALSPLTGVNEFDPDNDFLVRHYRRRCALFSILWKTGSSRNGEKADFLE
ncbi:MAG: hypothetical protein LBT05_09090 [Planctomycetaceae bacterium]|jgi:hypothetical protein|nr:hypothetical protein [Planctomycetaceae bacterium]